MTRILLRDMTLKRTILVFVVYAVNSIQPTYTLNCTSLYPFFSSHTSYSIVHGNFVSPFNNCTVKNMWTLVKNGAHYPQKEEIMKYKQLKYVKNAILENVDTYHSGLLCNEELLSFRSWEFKVEMNQSEHLSASGQRTIQEIGERFRKKFRHKIDQTPTANISVRVTSQTLTKMSAQALTDAIFKNKQAKPKFTIDDELLMNQKNCTAWTKREHNNSKYRQEKDKLVKSLLMEELIWKVGQRLGFIEPLSFGLVETLYSICSYEYSWTPTEKSPWCSAFTADLLKIMEYFKDLKMYYKYGYGNSLTERLGCQLLDDLIKILTGGEDRLAFNFADTFGLLEILVSLGIANKDPPLQGDDYDNAVQRQWRTSFLSPLSANLVAVRYHCESGTYGIKEEARVAFYLNENLLGIPGCGGQEMCGLSNFISTFKPKTDPSICNRDFCNLY